MWRKLICLGFLVICCYQNGVAAQSCVPHPVVSIELNEHMNINWTASENCPDTEYLVYISSNGSLQYEYSINGLSLDVSFLDYCWRYNFSVFPVSSNVLGPESTLQASIPIPEGLDIAILDFTTAELEDDVILRWHVEKQYAYCVSYYRMNIWDEDTDLDAPETIYTTLDGYYLVGAAKCMNYTFEVTAHYYRWFGTSGTYNYTVPGATNPPSLVYLRQDTATINTTWGFEKYSTNRCNVTNLYVRSARFNLTIPIQDVPERPTIDVSIPGLRADSMYYFNVTVQNTAGISTPFQLAVQTKPIDTHSEIIDFND